MEYEYQRKLEMQERLSMYYELWLQEACELLLKRIGAAHCLYLYETYGSVDEWPQEELNKAQLECNHIYALTEDYTAMQEYVEELDERRCDDF